MRRSKMLAKARSGEPVRITGMGHYIPHFIRYAAECGFDGIWLDLEHRAMDQREIQALLAYSHHFDVDILLRPPTIEKTGLYRYLEDGAAGLMIPHVSTPERARELVQAVKFPPLGDRGLDAAGLDSDFMRDAVPDYIENANRETLLCVQIETPAALERVDEIAAVEGVDALFIGGADLFMRLGQLEGPTPSAEAVRRRVGEAASRYGKWWGTPAGTQEDVAALRALGAQMIAHGGEFTGLIAELRRSQGVFDEVDGKA